MEIQKAYLGTKLYNYYAKWMPEPRDTPAQSPVRGLPETQGESPLGQAMHLAVQWPTFVAKSRASGDANHVTKHMEIKSIHPRVKTYNYHVKWMSGSHGASAQTPAYDCQKRESNMRERSNSLGVGL